MKTPPHPNHVLPRAGAREETEIGDGWQGAVQGVCCGGEKADLAGQSGSVWGWGLAPPKAVHCREGSSSVQQRPLHPAQFLQPFSQNTTARRSESQSSDWLNTYSSLMLHVDKLFCCCRWSLNWRRWLEKTWSCTTWCCSSYERSSCEREMSTTAHWEQSCSCLFTTWTSVRSALLTPAIR